MVSAIYKIQPYESGWGVAHDGSTVGPYETKEAAFEATVAAASMALREGHAVEITAPGREAETLVASSR
jgi:hypothetical protein